MGISHEDQYTFLVISCSFLLRVRNTSDRIVEKIKTHILHSVTLFQELCHLWDKAEKYCGAGQATDDNMACAPGMLHTQGYKHSNTYADQCTWLFIVMPLKREQL